MRLPLLLAAACCAGIAGAQPLPPSFPGLSPASKADAPAPARPSRPGQSPGEDLQKRLAALLAFLAVPALAQAQAVDTLEKIRDAKTVTIASRTDALPFSPTTSASSRTRSCRRAATRRSGWR